MVNGPRQTYVERAGRLEVADLSFGSAAEVEALARQMVEAVGRCLNAAQPYADARLPDGSRVNAILPPLSLSGPVLTIRKFAKNAMTTDDFIANGTWTRSSADFLRLCVRMRKNIVVSGGTGSGKTTLLNVLSSFVPSRERIVTVEDAAELQLCQPHVIRLEARLPDAEGVGEVTIRDLIRNCLRMRPDRIVMGECRGGEALDMLQAMNTGHDGSLTTVHANSARDALARLETMVLMGGVDLPSRAVREQIARAVEVIVHVARLSDGTRKVRTISQVTGLDDGQVVLQDLFVFRQTGLDAQGRVCGKMTATGAVPTWLDQVEPAGFICDIGLFDPNCQ